MKIMLQQPTDAIVQGVSLRRTLSPRGFHSPFNWSPATSTEEEELFQTFVNTQVLFFDLWELKGASQREQGGCVVSEGVRARDGAACGREERINGKQPPALQSVLTKALTEWLHRGRTSWQCSWIMGTWKCQLIYDTKLRPPVGRTQPLRTSCLLPAGPVQVQSSLAV